MTNPIAAAVAASSAKAAKVERRKSSIFSGRKMSLFGERKKSVVFAGGMERKKSIFAAVFGFAKDEDLSGWFLSGWVVSSMCGQQIVI